MTSRLDDARVRYLRAVLDIVLQHTEIPYQLPEAPFAGIRGWRDGLCVGLVLGRRHPDLVARLVTDVLDLSPASSLGPSGPAGRADRFVATLKAIADTLPADPCEYVEPARLLDLAGRLGDRAVHFNQAFPHLARAAAWLDALAVGLTFARRYPDLARSFFGHLCAMATLASDDPAERFEQTVITAAESFARSLLQNGKEIVRGYHRS